MMADLGGAASSTLLLEKIMDFENVCRLCAKQQHDLQSIADEQQNLLLADQIRDIVRVEYSESDGLPQKVCRMCVSVLQRIQETLDEYRTNDQLMRQQLLMVEVEVKVESLDHIDELVEYSLKEVKIEVLDKDSEDNEEWLDDDDARERPIVAEETDGANENTCNDEQTKSTAIGEQESPPSNGTETFVVEVAVKRKRGRRPRKEAKELSVRKRRVKPVEDPDRPRQNDFKCYICKSESLGSAQNLIDHLNTHTDHLPFTCQICVQETVELKQIRSLNMHLKMHQQPVKCLYCDRRYANERARDYHVQAFHLGDNVRCPSTCEECGKVCSSGLALRNHMRRHSNAFNCEYCGKAFESKSKLKRHILRVHEKTEGYLCGICQKRLTTIDAYELHVRTIHEGRRDYGCSTCERRFTTAAFLRMHHKHYEGGTCKPKPNWAQYYERLVIEDGTKRFTCKVCNKSNMRSIGEHLRTHFPESHVCPICGAKYSRKSSFDRHRRTHDEMVQNCFGCEKSFLSVKKMTAHLAKEHGIGQVLEVSNLPDCIDEEDIDTEFDVIV